MHKLYKYFIPGLFLLPFAVSAQVEFNEVNDFFGDATGFINDILIPILLALAFLVFVFGIVRYFLFTSGDGDENRNDGKQLMLWGIIAFVVIVSIWGIVKLLSEGLNLNDENLKDLPTVPRSN